MSNKLFKEDPRVTKSYKMLYDAFLGLLTEQPFNKITVAAICKKADLNRSTFYAHFEDKYQLLTCCFSDMITDITDEMLLSDKIEDLGVHIFEVIKKYHYLYEEIIIKKENYELRDILHNVIAQDLKNKYLKGDLVKQKMLEVNIYAECYAGSIISIITWWLRNGMVISVEEMGKHLDGILKNNLTFSKV